ncbi:hypothetical protein [uncultured Chryseobacterium sp.]|uniref:hypothetical protein n=1 Tax=uncultured Chryseobacterium sp. TaxID=259322 RepID=UPI0025911562|nr:hypothetical protein [uncultured Chryseobacterium sp.]
MRLSEKEIELKGIQQVDLWRGDWNRFASDALGVNLDKEQQKILESVQFNPRTSVASGTARGKDFVTAVSAICFMYLTPRWNDAGDLIANTKVALTAPTDRQVKNIMMPEISRLFNKAKKLIGGLPGRLNAYDIRTDWDEWFLTGFKADEHNHEAWSGFHAVNTMFAITEASGISDDTFGAIEGNLQGNSRILLVFNPNTTIGYAAKSQKGERWSKYRLNSLDAPNVIAKKEIIPGQVDHNWIQDKLDNWCTIIQPNEFSTEEDDFVHDGIYYRPTDIFRIKVLGKFPKVSEDSLIPEQWIDEANKRWLEYKHKEAGRSGRLIVGSDIAGMGRDNSVDVFRYGNFVDKFEVSNSAGVADHMKVAGKLASILKSNPNAYASIDTIGEGAGVFSRLEELKIENIISCKYSEKASLNDKPLKDVTEQYEFLNMRAYLFWCVRDWLNPKNGHNAMIPPNDMFKEEATEIKWFFRSDGKIQIESKEDIKKRLGRSIDLFDGLANTFYPIVVKKKTDLKKLGRMLG